MDESNQTCELCLTTAAGDVLWNSPACRIVRAADPYYPGFCRVIWNEHVREMGDLDAVQQHYLMSVVFAVEKVVNTLFKPDKINLASLGNVVPHLHWHIIPRWRDDRHFPEPIWGTVHRDGLVQRATVGNDEMALAIAAELKNLGQGS